MNVIANCPAMMILRVPWPMPRWRDIMQAMTGVMRKHGYYQKDIHSIEGLVPYPNERNTEDLLLVDKLERAYGGGSGFDKFWLYDWSGFRGGTFRLVREPTSV